MSCIILHFRCLFCKICFSTLFVLIIVSQRFCKFIPPLLSALSIKPLIFVAGQCPSRHRDFGQQVSNPGLAPEGDRGGFSPPSGSVSPPLGNF